MARTKQTARKSVTGSSPKLMLNSNTGTAYRQSVTSVQGLQLQTSNSLTGNVRSHPEETKSSFVNYENTFYSYGFCTGERETIDIFNLRLSSAISQDILTGENETFLGLSLVSKLDGDGIKELGRPPIDLIVALDISGSMSSPFNSQTGNETKLDIAKRCLTSLVLNMKPGDRVGVVVFNHNADVLCDIAPWGDDQSTAIVNAIQSLRSGGGTMAAEAMMLSSTRLREVRDQSDTQGDRSSRILFFTDLQTQDEATLLSLTQENAQNGIWTTVIGVGIDFNVELVERISKLPGCRYSSVISPEEFETLVVEEFDYDVTPVAFNINITIHSSDFELLSGYGSPEVNDVKPGQNVIQISSEFPTALDSEGLSKGGMLLFKLGPKTASTNARAKRSSRFRKRAGHENPEEVESTEFKDLEDIKEEPEEEAKQTNERVLRVECEFENANGLKSTVNHTIEIPRIESEQETHFVAQESFSADPAKHGSGIRKAIALVRYVDLHNAYVKNTPKKSHAEYFDAFSKFRNWYCAEMEALGESTQTDESAISDADKNKKVLNGELQILDKIIELEGKDSDQVDQDSTQGTQKRIRLTRATPAKNSTPTRARRNRK